jgi:hypothetical protein
MPLDIYSRAGNNFAGAISADGARATFAADSGAGGDTGLILQQISMQYQQQVSRIFEIGTNNTYYVAGRCQGNATTGFIVGPRTLQLAFYQKYGNVCNAAGNILVFSAAAGCVGGDVPRNANQAAGGTFKFTMRNCVINGIAVTIANPQDMIINQQLQIMFVSLELTTSGSRT